MERSVIDIRTIIRYLLGDRQAILDIAGCRSCDALATLECGDSSPLWISNRAAARNRQRFTR